MFTRWCASSAGSCSPQSGGSETKLIRYHSAHTHIHKNIFQSVTDIAQVKTAAAYFTRRLPYWSCAQRWHHPQGVDYGLKEASGGPVDGLYSDSMLQIAVRRPQSPPIYSHCPAAPHASSPPDSVGWRQTSLVLCVGSRMGICLSYGAVMSNLILSRCVFHQLGKHVETAR